jgi:hypothetical protein
MAMDETTQLWYLRPSSLYKKEKPYHIFEQLPQGFKTSNLAFEQGPEQSIVDVRSREHRLTLEEHGFAFRTRPPPSLNWDDDAEINVKHATSSPSYLSLPCCVVAAPCNSTSLYQLSYYVNFSKLRAVMSRKPFLASSNPKLDLYQKRLYKV